MVTHFYSIREFTGLTPPLVDTMFMLDSLYVTSSFNVIPVKSC